MVTHTHSHSSTQFTQLTERDRAVMVVMGRSQARFAVRGGGRDQVKGRGKEELGTDRLMI